MGLKFELLEPKTPEANLLNTVQVHFNLRGEVAATAHMWCGLHCPSFAYAGICTVSPR